MGAIVRVLADFGEWVMAGFVVWYGWLGSSALAGLIGIGQGLKLWQPTIKTYEGLLAVGVIISFFGAWREQHRKAAILDAERGIPKPFLTWKENRNVSSIAAEFFVQVEGDKNASDVEITSEQVMGTNGKFIAMQWQVPKEVIGKTPVPVKAKCLQYTNNEAHWVAVSPGQIGLFFERKLGDNELEVTMKFKDVDGRECPPKKVRISRDRDLDGNFQIGISPNRE